VKIVRSFGFFKTLFEKTVWLVFVKLKVQTLDSITLSILTGAWTYLSWISLYSTYSCSYFIDNTIDKAPGGNVKPWINYSVNFWILYFPGSRFQTPPVWQSAQPVRKFKESLRGMTSHACSLTFCS
jgi:hypothetical protein